MDGLSEEQVRRLAVSLRERGGGFVGLRALGLRLPSKGRFQVSMNLEDVKSRKPFCVFEEIEDFVCGPRVGRWSVQKLSGPSLMVWSFRLGRTGLSFWTRIPPEFYPLG